MSFNGLKASLSRNDLNAGLFRVFRAFRGSSQHTTAAQFSTTEDTEYTE